MRILFAFLGVLALVGTAFAGYPPVGTLHQPDAVPCNFPCICYDWDFAVSNQGFTAPHSCDTGGVAVWQYGTTTYVPGAPGAVWGTVLNSTYPNNSGDALWSPNFTVTDDCKYVEIYHYFYTESSYDGCNVKFNDTLITPQGGYTGQINTSTSYYAFCVDMEMGWTGLSNGWRAECFDLSQFVGQSGHLSFEMGSDSSVTYAGWYIAYVKVGGYGATPVEDSTWGHIKGLFH
jgi:hypothetical protein